MAIERSHGKARPTLPRLSDVPTVKSERKPTDGRGADGRFAAGNRVSVGAGWKNSVKRLLGRYGSDEVSNVVARDSRRLFMAVMRELPSDGAMVRQLAALQARHAALAAFFTAKATAMGLDEPDAIAMLTLASQHGQRAERLAVTALDVAAKMAAAERARPTKELPPWLIEDEAASGP